MTIGGHQINEGEIIDTGYDGSDFTVSDLIDYVLNNPDEFRKEIKFNPQKGVWFISAVSGLHYATHAGAGDISRVLIDGRVYIPMDDKVRG